MSAPIDVAASRRAVGRAIAGAAGRRDQELRRARGSQRRAAAGACRRNRGVTATEAMLAVSAIMKAVNVQVFELGMWQSWSGR